MSQDRACPEITNARARQPQDGRALTRTPTELATAHTPSKVLAWRIAPSLYRHPGRVEVATTTPRVDGEHKNHDGISPSCWGAPPGSLQLNDIVQALQTESQRDPRY